MCYSAFQTKTQNITEHHWRVSEGFKLILVQAIAVDMDKRELTHIPEEEQKIYYF